MRLRSCRVRPGRVRQLEGLQRSRIGERTGKRQLALMCQCGTSRTAPPASCWRQKTSRFIRSCLWAHSVSVLEPRDMACENARAYESPMNHTLWSLANANSLGLTFSLSMSP